MALTMTGRAYLCGCLPAMLAAASALFPAVFTQAVLASPSTATVSADQANMADQAALADYRSRLQSLDSLVASCQTAPGAETCSAVMAGDDIALNLSSGKRQFRLDWLRELLTQAYQDEEAKEKAKQKSSAQAPGKASPDKAAGDAAKQAANPKAGESPAAPPQEDAEEERSTDFPEPSTAARLQLARDTLQQEMKLAGDLSARLSSGLSAPAQPGDGFSTQRKTLDRILSAQEYKPVVARRTLQERILEKLAGWINDAVDALRRTGANAPWLGLALEIGFLSLVLLALIWFLIRLERQGRLGPMLIRPERGTGAASARDWQLWLQDARNSAAAGAWREAIHFLYWASISRLESSGLWPADRARTPREYLALLAPESAHRSDLAALTRSFEGTWYAGRTAGEADYQNAMQIAGRLGAR